MSQEERRRVRVMVRVGDMEFEIEADEDQIESSVEKVLAGALRAREKAGLGVVGVTKREVRKERTCKGLIEDLWSEGWFSVGRSLGEVHEELGRRGYHYDRTAVAHALLDLVRENILTRMGKPRRYRYIQKRPPPGAGARPPTPEVGEPAQPEISSNPAW